MFNLLRKAQKQLIWVFCALPLLLNYLFWLHGGRTSYAMSADFEHIFWILLPLVSLVAYIQIDSSAYLPSFRKLGLTWQLSYFLEKSLHLVCCILSMASFLYLLTALLIRAAPVHYMEANTTRLEQMRFLTYHYYWQLNTGSLALQNYNFKIGETEYKWLENKRHEPVSVRVKHNIAGASITITK